MITSADNIGTDFKICGVTILILYSHLCFLNRPVLMHTSICIDPYHPVIHYSMLKTKSFIKCRLSPRVHILYPGQYWQHPLGCCNLRVCCDYEYIDSIILSDDNLGFNINMHCSRLLIKKV